MTVAHLDDNFPEHPKVEPLSDKAFRAHVMAICHCRRNTTDGHLSATTVRGIAARLNSTPKRWLPELVAAGLWHAAPNGDGHWIHDYQKYNSTAAEERAVRDKKREAGRKGARARWQMP
jgi:hypothetical protein